MMLYYVISYMHTLYGRLEGERAHDAGGQEAHALLRPEVRAVPKYA